MKKTIIIAVVLGVGAGIGGRMMLLRSDAGPRAADAVSAPAADQVSANGTVEGARPEVALRPEVSGILTSVKVRENDAVEKGQVVAELSNESQKAQVALARAELVVASELLKKLEAGERAQVIAHARAEEAAKAAAYEKARNDAERTQRTAGGLSASDRDAYATQMKLARADWDKAKADLALVQEGARAEDVAAARAQVEVARARLRAAEADLAKTRLTALTSGKVLQVYAEPGELASPTSAQPVLLMADLSKRRVRAFVEELDVDRIAVGQSAVVTADGLPGKTFTGEVAVAVPRMGKRAPQSDAPNEMKDLYYREVLIDLDGGQELPTNLRVQVRIQAKVREQQ
jgi:multidrug resistance efflux pump